MSKTTDARKVRYLPENIWKPLVGPAVLHQGTVLSWVRAATLSNNLGNVNSTQYIAKDDVNVLQQSESSYNRELSSPWW